MYRNLINQIIARDGVTRALGFRDSVVKALTEGVVLARLFKKNPEAPKNIKQEQTDVGAQKLFEDVIGMQDPKDERYHWARATGMTDRLISNLKFLSTTGWSGSTSSSGEKMTSFW